MTRLGIHSARMILAARLLAVAAALAAVAAVTAAHAASTKLNPTPPGGGARVASFALTPDGARVIYRADLERVGADEVYNVAIDGSGGSVKISGPLVNGGSVSSSATGLAISPDGTRVVYVADAEIDGVNELYSVAAGGTDRVKLNPALQAGRNVSSFAISADSRHVVYRADQDTPGIQELYSVPIGGGSPIKLNGTLTPGGRVVAHALSPDGTRAIYQADQDTAGVIELYTSPVATGGAVKLSPTLASPAEVSTFRVPAAGSRVIFTVTPDKANINALLTLYSAPFDGATPATQLDSGVVQPGGAIFALTFTISPGGGHVVYTATASGKTWLYSTPTAGGTPARLNDDPRVIERVQNTFAAFSPDSTRVIYPAGDELWAVSVAGGAVTSLSGPMVAGGNVSVAATQTFAVTPDNQRAIYLADQQTFGVTELFSVPLGGGPVTKLNGTLAENGDVSAFAISPNSGRVVYRAQQDTKDINELYAVSPGGGAIKKLNSAVVTGGGVTSTFRVSADSQRVVYLARQESATVQELYSAPLFGPPTSVAAAVLPASRSVQVGSPATVFATIVNTGSSAGEACGVALGPGVAAGFWYQTTDPSTNALSGSPNTPADVGVGGSQSFVLQLTPTAPTPAVEVPFAFQCGNSGPAPVVVGLNTLLLSAATSPVPDVIALARTLTGDGIVDIPGPNGTGVFAVATANVGAGASITVRADTGESGTSATAAAGLPIHVTLCQSDPVTAACVNPPTPAETVTATIGAGQTPTFSLFVQGQGVVPFDPAGHRIFVRFRDGTGVTRGATSVAVRTQ